MKKLKALARRFFLRDQDDKPYSTSHHIEFLSGLPVVAARYKGGRRPISQIKHIIIHRLARANARAATFYQANPSDGRIVSWHYTVAEDGSVIKHLPLSRVGYHCKYPKGTNAESVGIELYGPFGSPISKDAHAAVRRLCVAICAVCSIETISSHRYMDSLGPRKNRRDPGPEFDWSWLDDIGPRCNP